MVVGYQNLLTLVSLKLVYNPPLLNLTSLKKKKKFYLVLLKSYLASFYRDGHVAKDLNEIFILDNEFQQYSKGLSI